MKQAKKQSPVSLQVLIIAGVGLIAIAYLYFSPQSNPEDTAVRPESASAPEVISQSATVGQEINGKLIKEKSSPKVGEEESNIAHIASRDPFAPPQLVRDLLSKKDVKEPAVPRIVPHVANNDKPAPQIKDEIKEVEKPRENRPVWKGTLETKNDQIVIIETEKKSYFLRLGDRLPGTGYSLKAIGKNFILLNSPNVQLRLERGR